MSLEFDDLDPRMFVEGRKKASYFSEKFLGITPYYYQVPFLDDTYRRKAACFSRQLGKTFAVAIKASQKINMFPGSRVGIIAHNERRAIFIYRTVRQLQKINPVLRDLIEYDTQKEMRLNLYNRFGEPSVITFFAAGQEGDAIRGEPLDLLLMDEADFIAPNVFPAALPTVTATHGDILMTSTPNVKYTPFYNRFMDGWTARQKFEGKMKLEEGEEPYNDPLGRKFGYVSYHYDYTHGLNVTNPKTGMPQTDILEVNAMKEDDYHKYQREYEAWWTDELGVFFPEKVIRNSIVENRFRLEPLTHKPFNVMGIDFARANDFTAGVIAEINRNYDMMNVIHTFKVNKQDWEIIFREVVRNIKNFNVRSIVYDKKNVGDVLGVWLRKVSKMGADYNLRGELMDTVPKAQMYNNAKMGMSMGRIFIQKRHEDLLYEMRRLQKEDSHISRVVKLHAPEGEFDDHSDAFVLAASHIKFMQLEGMDNMDSVPYYDFFDVYEPDKQTDVMYADVFGGDIWEETGMDFEIQPSYEF